MQPIHMIMIYHWDQEMCLQIITNWYKGCLNIYGIYVIADNSTNNNSVLFFVSDLKTISYNNY